MATTPTCRRVGGARNKGGRACRHADYHADLRRFCESLDALLAEAERVAEHEVISTGPDDAGEFLQEGVASLAWAAEMLRSAIDGNLPCCDLCGWEEHQ